jgi:hypothetical protein
MMLVVCGDDSVHESIWGRNENRSGNSRRRGARWRSGRWGWLRL